MNISSSGSIQQKLKFVYNVSGPGVGVTDGVGVIDGIRVTEIVPVPFCPPEGEGTRVGFAVAVTVTVGAIEGFAVGAVVGAVVGFAVGAVEGDDEGLGLGDGDGDGDGSANVI